MKLPPEQPQILVPVGQGRAASPGRRRPALGRGDARGAERRRHLQGPHCPRLRSVASLRRGPRRRRLGAAGRSQQDRAAPGLRTGAEDGRSKAFRVIELGERRAANGFESVLRAVLEDVPGAQFEPQVWVGNTGRADLVDRQRRVVVEADSFEFHSDAAALNRDMVRYNAFLGEGHLVLRFGHAIFEQDYARATVGAVIAPLGRSVRWCPRCDAA